MTQAQPLRTLEHWRILDVLPRVVWHGDMDPREFLVGYVYRARDLRGGSLLVILNFEARQVQK